MKLRYGPPVESDDDFAGIVSRTKDLHTLTRSTVPLLAWWRDHAQDKLLPGVDLANAVARFEYAVPARCPSCVGRGKASMTDVMVLLDDRAIAIEGKYTESRYDTVDVWKTRGKDRDNRKAVLGHWCHLIRAVTDHPVDDRLGGLVYQTLHRTASACAAAGTDRRAHVMYLVFDDTAANTYVADLRRAAEILDPAGKIDFSVVAVRTTRGDDFSELERLVNAAASVEDRVELIADTLLTKRPIYDFHEHLRPAIR